MTFNRVVFYIVAALVLVAPQAPVMGAAISQDQLKARITEATKDFKDLTVVGNAVNKNKKALGLISSDYARLYEFKTATVYLKMPDKLRMEGKLGMVKFEYIISGGWKIARSPTVKFNKKEDYSSDPAKLQDALDLGLVTPTLWDHRRVEVVDDPEAEAAGEIKLSLRWQKGDMVNLIWIDAKDLWLKKFEKRDAAGNVLVRTVYSNPEKVCNVIWIPKKVEMYACNGELAGTSEYTDIKVNSGLADSLFQ